MSKLSLPRQGRYPPELRERAVRMIKEAIAESGGERHGVVTRAIQLAIGSEYAAPLGEAGGGRRRSATRGHVRGAPAHLSS